MNLHDILKNNITLDDANETYINFCSRQNKAYVSVIGKNNTPLIDCIDYVFINNIHYLLCFKNNYLSQHLTKYPNISAMLYKERENANYAMYDKRVRLIGIPQIVESTSKKIGEVEKVIPNIRQLIKGNNNLFELKITSGQLNFSPAEVFHINKNNKVDSIGELIEGVPRYSYSRYVLLEYSQKTAILNVYVENGTYYALTNRFSNKIKYLRNNNQAKIYDGKNNSFYTQIEILENNWINKVYELLENTNNNYFANKDNLVVLKFNRQ